MRPGPDCALCGLHRGRTNIVLPDGNPSYGIVFVGEGPGEFEDLEGRPFVGRSGKILDNMMREAGFDRTKVMITNTVKCRPPNNRDPMPEEMAACRPFLESELYDARLVVGLGKSACRDLMGYEGPMSEIVNIPITIKVRDREIVFIPTYHPAATIPIPGAKEYVTFLKDEGIPSVFLTNNSSHGRSFYLQKLTRLGFDVGMENILTSTIATIRYLLTERPGKTVYPVAVPDVVEEMRAAGVPLVEEDPDIVVLTFDTTITYEKINRAFHYLRSGSELIATHPDDVCPTEDSYDIDIGPFIRMFEQMCQTVATVIGKPNRLMLEMAAGELGVPPEDTVMVGDRLTTDIEMAVRAGTQSVLVLSGETDRDMLARWGKEPTAVVESVADIPDMVRGLRGHPMRERPGERLASPAL